MSSSLLPNGKNIMENKSIEIAKIWFEGENICISTKDGRKGSHPLKWFPRLKNATEKQRQNFELSPFGIHWSDIDEDLSYEGFFDYEPSAMPSK